MSLALNGGSILGLTGRFNWEAGPIVRPTEAGAGYSLTVQEPVSAPRALAGSVSSDTVKDRVIQTTVGPTTVTDYTWNWAPSDSNTGGGEVTRESTNPAVIIPTPGDPYRWTFVSNGTATIRLITTSGLTYQRAITTSTSGGSSTSVVTGCAAGSLRKHLIESFDARLVGKTPSTGLRIFSTYSPATAGYVRNPDCWAYGYDLTPISPGNSGSANLWAGVMVSPRHLIVCAHASMAVGSLLHLVTADNVVVARTITALQTVAGYAPYYPDIRVGVLNADVPGTISFARILADGWPEKIPDLGINFPLPALTLDQEEKALVTDLYELTAAPGAYGAMARFAQPTDLQRLAFYEPKIGGDSGNPALLMIGGQLVLLTVWTFGAAGSGTSLAYWKAAVNAVMSALGGGYQLTEMDLSGFPNFT